ncbi:MAG: ribonuclease III [Ardenticatenaceae bacterium]|nr:ribonuclease III [Anaerolineales bacterium]MCB8921278.1 ribonuclease III [Ardenticatenaceae bacterium]MCB8990644.1 ribonuclease III [Ardenticatenaceae bacterium]
MNDYIELEQNLGVEFRDYSLLTRALTHRSFLNENPGGALEDNERLEFLGDAVLDFVVGAYLYHHYPEMDEGELTSLRAALVRAETLAAFARELEIGRFLRLGYGEAENGGRERVPILCATFEAVIGAVYLDQGLGAAKVLTEELISAELPHILASSAHKDAKSEFQVWAQARYNITPRYRVVKTSGPDHAKIFTLEVMVRDVAWGEGEGSSKQLAAQAAAQAALAKANEMELMEA